MATVDPLGQGFAFPFQIDTRGAIASSAGESRVRDAILVILGTQPGERLMRPDFGCPLRDLVYAPNTAATASLARFYIQDALARWEPRAEVVRIDAQNAQAPHGTSMLTILMEYRIRATGASQALRFLLPLA
jgi:phage baseplate assembly protein W